MQIHQEPATASREKKKKNQHIVSIHTLACNSEGYLTRKGAKYTNIKTREYSFSNIWEEKRKSFLNYIVLANSDL